jgi:hypothetical protein
VSTRDRQSAFAAIINAPRFRRIDPVSCPRRFNTHTTETGQINGRYVAGLTIAARLIFLEAARSAAHAVCGR